MSRGAARRMHVFRDMNSAQPRSATPSVRRIGIASGVLALVVTALAAASPTAEHRPTPPCVQFWPEARYRNYAYDHVVHLSNACQTRALCAVSSDLSPTAINVDLAIGESTEVLTLRGSPAREFNPRVDCGLVL